MLRNKNVQLHESCFISVVKKIGTIFESSSLIKEKQYWALCPRTFYLFKSPAESELITSLLPSVCPQKLDCRRSQRDQEPRGDQIPPRNRGCDPTCRCGSTRPAHRWPNHSHCGWHCAGGQRWALQRPVPRNRYVNQLFLMDIPTANSFSIWFHSHSSYFVIRSWKVRLVSLLNMGLFCAGTVFEAVMKSSDCGEQKVCSGDVFARCALQKSSFFSTSLVLCLLSFLPRCHFQSLAVRQVGGDYTPFKKVSQLVHTLNGLTSSSGHLRLSQPHGWLKVKGDL